MAARLPGVKTDKIILIGASMGNLVALNWLRANPTKVIAYIGLLPAVNIAAIHDDAGLGLATVIETAYGGTAAYAAAETSHDPMQNTGSYSGIPMKLWYSPDDPVTPPWMSNDFISAVGGSASASSISGATGHSDMALDSNEVLSYIQAYS